MNVNRILHIRDGDAVKTFQDFLAVWWRRVELDAMLAPVELPDHAGVLAQIISQPAELSNVNPFAPVLLNNSASLVEEFVGDHPRSHLAVILRPCELRALIELQKRKQLHDRRTSLEGAGKSLVIISVDCPGTFSLAEYTRLAAQGHEDARMIRVELVYGWRPSYIPHPVRTACQMCDSSDSLGADLIIGTIGSAAQGNLLVIARDEHIDADLQLREVTDDFATDGQVGCREVMVRKLANKRLQKRSEWVRSPLWQTVEMPAALGMFARCTLCADCLDACPLYGGELSGMLGVREAHQNSPPLLSELVSVSRWLASCTGCGMCQEACEQHIALTSLVAALSDHIQNELQYKPGNPAQRLPWTI